MQKKKWCLRFFYGVVGGMGLTEKDPRTKQSTRQEATAKTEEKKRLVQLWSNRHVSQGQTYRETLLVCGDEQRKRRLVELSNHRLAHTHTHTVVRRVNPTSTSERVH